MAGGGDHPATLAEEYVKRYCLNEDQAKVMKQVAQWFVKNGGSRRDSRHSILGLESFLLAVLTIFVAEVLGGTDTMAMEDEGDNAAGESDDNKGSGAVMIKGTRTLLWTMS